MSYKQLIAKPVRERSVELHLHREVVKAGGTTRKFKSPGRSNAPDRIVIWPIPSSLSSRMSPTARVHFVECKAPGKEPRPGQEREFARLRALGCTVLVLDTKAKVDDYVARNR